KENSERLTTLEKISNNERIRFNGRTITVSNENSDRTSELQNVLTNSIKLISQKIDEPIMQIFYKTDLPTSINAITINVLQPTTTGFYTITSDIVKDVGVVSHDVSNSTPVILLLLVPLSGYILLRSEEDKIKLNKNQIFSFCFILILVSSSTVTPFAISQNYWGMAFAEPQNQTSDVNNTVSNGTAPNTGSITVPTNETNSTVSSNSTKNYNLSILVSNSTVSNKTGSIIHTNQTNYNLPSTNSTVSVNHIVSNQTASTPNYLSYGLSTGIAISDGITILRNGTVPPVQANSDLSTGISVTDSITILRNGTVPPENATSGLFTSLSIADSINVIKIGITVPEPTKSWNFTSTNGTIGKARAVNNTLNLQGNGYLKQSINSTNTLNNFTVSAWIKPDYSQGSPVFA
ncbi:MAG: hypothetical protein LV477_12845, partial [Candidatus Nitrosotalea sp.]|nr:hypothetical protein [Candidatus Nitrosotalea sp.]